MKRICSFLSIFLLLFTLSACDINRGRNVAGERQRAATQQLTAQADIAVGMPGVTNFTERRFAKLLYELRDQEMSTYTYIADINGKLHFVCRSLGYGIPYSVQYTAPEAPQFFKSQLTGVVGQEWQVPQPDPNGLYMPTGLSATFVMCVDKEGELRPIYMEPEIIVSPFELNEVDSWQKQ